MTQSSMQFMSNAWIQLYNVNHHHPGKMPSVRALNGGISNLENLWIFTCQCEDELQCQVNHPESNSRHPVANDF